MDYVKRTFSIRLDDQTIAALERQSERLGQSPRTLAQQYVEEGLRQADHPLIRFVDGPAGRRAALMGRLDVWEVIATLRDNDGNIGATRDYLDLPARLMDAAVTYYGAYRDEIDGEIDANDREADEAEAAWLAGREAVGS